MMIILQVVITVILFVYVIIAALAVAFGLWIISKPDIVPPAENSASDFVIRNFIERAKIAVVGEILVLPASALTWPIAANAGRTHARRRSDRQWGARFGLRPLDGPVAIGVLVVALILTFLLSTNLAWQPLLAAMSWVTLVAIVGKEVSYLVSPLPDRLRQASRPPWLSFILIAGADALALTFAVVSLRIVWAGGELDLQSVAASFVDLFNAPRNLTELVVLTPAEMVVAGIGFLYYAAFVKTLVSRSHFTRTDQDYRMLASRSVLTGNIDDANRWMEKEKQRTAESHWVRCQIALASGQLERAEAAAGRLLVAKEERDSKDARIRAMVGVSLWAPMTDDQAVALCRYILANASDGTASTLVGGVLLDYPDIGVALAQSVSKHREPLTYAAIMAAQGEIELAAEALERTSSRSDIEEVLRLVRLCRLQLAIGSGSEKESEEDLSRWASSSLQIVKDLTARLDPSEQNVPVGDLVELEFALEEFDNAVATGLREEVHTLADDLSEPPDVSRKLRSMLRKAMS